MKIVVCDNCDSKDIFYSTDNNDLCEHHYHNSEFYEMTELEEDWGVETGRILAKYDAFLSFNYETFNEGYKDEAQKYADELNDIFKKLGIKGIKAFGDADPEEESNAFICFKKIK